MNRHLVVPDDLDSNAYYKIDSIAKNKKYRNKWVKVTGMKWIQRSQKISWKCQLISTGKDIHTLYLDGTTRREKSVEQTKKWITHRRERQGLVLRPKDRDRIVVQLENVIHSLESGHVE